VRPPHRHEADNTVAVTELGPDGVARRSRTAPDLRENNRRIATPGGLLAYTRAGSGPAVVLVHGLGGSRHTWRELIGPLSQRHTVIALDLPGHGDSEAPPGDYSPGAHAAAIRDLMVALGISSAALVGHSLGGGIAVQFAYQFPDNVSRLVLISSGGFGPGVTPLLRAAMLPGAEVLLRVVGTVPGALTRRALRIATVLTGAFARDDVDPISGDLRGMSDRRRRHSFVRTARAVLDWHGQTARATPYLKTLVDVPIMLVWGTDDRTIPPSHHEALAGTLPADHVLEIRGAGHYPHETAAEQILPRLEEFLLPPADCDDYASPGGSRQRDDRPVFATSPGIARRRHDD
jgi:pimeloyl-ACP methyl ester carboxylesterase